MTRPTAILLALVLILITPLMLFFLLLQALGGSVDRAHHMELALDFCGNSLFGGDPRISISCRTGNGAKLGYKWAVRLAPIIDFFFGKNHCLNATIPDSPN